MAPLRISHSFMECGFRYNLSIQLTILSFHIYSNSKDNIAKYVLLEPIIFAQLFFCLNATFSTKHIFLESL